jgi:hypothetical protein
VTLASVVSDRYARWVTTLDRYGYIIEQHPRIRTSARLGTIGLRGRRRTDLGAPAVVIDIAERWDEGPDSDGLGLEQHGCHLVASGWHAQLEPGGQGAERLDVDRLKRRELTIHRHPFGSSNDERTPRHDLPAPEGWIRDIETLSADRYFS